MTYLLPMDPTYHQTKVTAPNCYKTNVPELQVVIVTKIMNSPCQPGSASRGVLTSMACDEKHHAAWKSQEQHKNKECLEKGTARTFKHGDLMFLFSVHSSGKIYALKFTSRWLSLPGKVMVAQCFGGYIYIYI